MKMNVICARGQLAVSPFYCRVDRYGRAFMPYCNLATIGLSLMKVKSLRFAVKGIGMMRVINSTISKTRRAKTCVCGQPMPQDSCVWYWLMGADYGCVD